MKLKPWMRPWLGATMLLCLCWPAALAQSDSAATAPKSDTNELAPPEHPATEAQIREYYALTHTIEAAHRVMDKMVDGMQATSAPYLPPSMWDDFRSSFAHLDLEAAFVPAYQKYFSEQDMQSVLDFYKSPAGRRLLNAQPFITSVASDVLRKEGQKIGEEVYLRHKAEIDAAKAKYDAGQGAGQGAEPPIVLKP